MQIYELNSDLQTKKARYFRHCYNPKKPKDMTPQEKLISAYNALRYSGVVQSRKDFAETLGYNYNVLSSAFNGAERYLTPNLFRNIGRQFPQINPDWLAGDGEGDPLLPEARMASREARSRADDRMGAAPYDSATMKALEQTERALDQMERLIRIIEKMVGVNIGSNCTEV